MVICFYQHDEKTTRCPSLGHLVPFSYCRTLSNNLPCRKVLDCWHEIFDIQSFIKNTYSEEEIDAFLSPPKPKINQILELIEKAKKAMN